MLPPYEGVDISPLARAWPDICCANRLTASGFEGEHPVANHWHDRGHGSKQVRVRERLGQSTEPPPAYMLRNAVAVGSKTAPLVGSGIVPQPSLTVCFSSS